MKKRRFIKRISIVDIPRCPQMKQRNDNSYRCAFYNHVFNCKTEIARYGVRIKRCSYIYLPRVNRLRVHFFGRIN